MLGLGIILKFCCFNILSFVVNLMCVCAAAACREAHDNGKLGLDSLDFGRRAAVEAELDRSDALNSQNALFDESGHIIIYPTLVQWILC